MSAHSIHYLRGAHEGFVGQTGRDVRAKFCCMASVVSMLSHAGAEKCTIVECQVHLVLCDVCA